MVVAAPGGCIGPPGRGRPAHGGRLGLPGRHRDAPWAGPGPLEALSEDRRLALGRILADLVLREAAWGKGRFSPWTGPSAFWAKPTARPTPWTHSSTRLVLRAVRLAAASPPGVRARGRRTAFDTRPLRPAGTSLAGETAVSVTEVVIGVILSEPRRSAADPQITPVTQSFGQSLRSPKSGVFGIDSVLAGLGHGLDVSRVVAFVSSLGSRSMGGGLPMLRDRWPGVWFRCAARCRWRRLGGRAGAGGIPPGQ